jgi:hypothetical protein
MTFRVLGWKPIQDAILLPDPVRDLNDIRKLLLYRFKELLLSKHKFPGLKLEHLLETGKEPSPDLLPLLAEKCDVRNATYKSPNDFISEDLLAVGGAEWAQQLLSYVPDAPPAEELLPQVLSLIISIWE